MTEREIAIEAVLKASRLCQRVQAEMVKEDTLQKKDRSPVTVADFGSQALVCQALSETLPEDVIVAEENAKALRENPEQRERVTQYVSQELGETPSETVCEWIDRGAGEVGERFWTLDPIDGTKGFLRSDQYAIALALLIDGEIQLGVLACPNLPQALDTPGSPVGCLFVAERGKGTEMLSLSGSPGSAIHVSDRSPRFAESFESAHGDQDAHDAITTRLGIVEPPIRIDSQAKYGLVARGDAAIYLRLPNPATPDYRECIWDHAAGVIVVEEAGGKVTDAEGQPFDFLKGRRLTANHGVVATNGNIHSQLLEAIQQVAQP